MAGRIITGIEGKRVKLRSAANRVIAEVRKFDLAPLSPDTRSGWLKPPPLATFTELEPLGFGLTDEDWWIFPPEDIPDPTIVWPMDTAAIIETEGGGVRLVKVRTITPRECRGSVTRFSPYMLRMDYAETIDRRMFTAAGVYVWVGGKWAEANGHVRFTAKGIREADTPMPADDAQIPSVMMGIALNQRYQWGVSLGRRGTPSIRFATDPTGIKEFFRFRDLPEGRDRRESLLNWVSDHWRQNRHDPDVEVYVRKHMRGSTHFGWADMLCTIRPAPYDMEKLEGLRRERNAMRIAGVDRRNK